MSSSLCFSPENQPSWPCPSTCQLCSLSVIPILCHRSLKTHLEMKRIVFQWKGSGIGKMWSNPSGKAYWRFACFVCTELWIHLLIFLPHQWLRCGHFSYTLQYNEEERHTKPSIIILYETYTMVELGSPGGSDSRESACNAGDLGLIPGSGSSPGEGIGYPLQYSLASLVAQTVKNPPAMQETRARFLGQEDPLERRMATYSISNLSSLAWRIPQTQPGCLQTSLWLCLLSLLLSCPRRGGHDWVNSTFTFMTELCEGHSEDIS